jgi:hypothetical protein
MSRNVTVIAVLTTVLVLGGVLACALTPSVVQAPPTSTFTPTKTPRPTFTPTPVYTPTPTDTPTPVATDTPVPTDTPTPAPPTDTPTPLPPTNTPKPAPPTDTPTPPPPPPTEPPPFPYEIVENYCPVPPLSAEKTIVAGAVLDANGEPVMEGVVVAYDAASSPRNEHPWARDLQATGDPKRWDVAKMDKKEWRADWGGKWMNYQFEMEWYNVLMGGAQDAYRDIFGEHPSYRTTLDWSVWVESLSGERLSEIATCKTYSHPPDPDDPEPNGPTQCFIFFKLR